jgi:hypothetical protein
MVVELYQEIIDLTDTRAREMLLAAGVPDNSNDLEAQSLLMIALTVGLTDATIKKVISDTFSSEVEAQFLMMVETFKFQCLEIIDG